MELHAAHWTTGPVNYMQLTGPLFGMHIPLNRACINAGHLYKRPLPHMGLPYDIMSEVTLFASIICVKSLLFLLLVLAGQVMMRKI